MNQLIPTSKPTETALRKLKRQEISAKLVPYVTFILTHLALVILLITSFFADRLGIGPTFKVVLAIIAVLCILSEMLYIVKVAIDWHRNVTTLLDIQEKQRRSEEAARLKEKEDALALEQHRNNVLLNERQRRQQNGNGNNRSAAAFTSSPVHGHVQSPRQGFPAFAQNTPQPMSASPYPTNTPPQNPFPQFTSNNTPGQSFPQYANNGNGQQPQSSLFPNTPPAQPFISSQNQMQPFPQSPDITPRRPLASSPNRGYQQGFPPVAENTPQSAFPQFPQNGTQNASYPTGEPQKNSNPNQQNWPWPTSDPRQ